MSRDCTVIGITGGISTGKSSFSKHLLAATGATWFDADRAARALVDNDTEVRELLREEFGAEIFSEAEDLNRAALRAIIFSDPEKKRALEQILHPRIRLQWATEAEHCRKTGALFLADIPLLYETEGENLCDSVVVVASSLALQQERLMQRSRLSFAQAAAMISAQMPLSEKISRADHLVWNNGPAALLQTQAKMLAQLWR